MTISELKDLLRNYQVMSDKLHNIQDEIDTAKAEAQAVRETNSVILDGMPHGNALSDPTQRKAQQIIDIYNQRVSDLLDERLAIIERQQALTDYLRDLTPDEYAIVKARYLDGVRWDFLPAAVNMSRRTCFYVHDKAMSKLVKALNNKVIKRPYRRS